MLILLPPSESKTAPKSGAALDFSRFKYPQYNALRETIAAKLIEISKSADSLAILRAGISVKEIILAQQELFTLPCAPAREIYTGVLYDALKLNHANSIEFAASHIIIFSGLFGVLSPNDLIPAYRLSMGINLPGLGNNKTLWKQELKDFNAGENELVIDCRSGNYQVWNPPRNSDWVTINAVQDNAGKRKTISHDAKRYRGLLAQMITHTCSNLQNGTELADFASAHLIGKEKIVDLELHPKNTKNARQLTLVLRK